jgi:hypothetical protein
VKWQVFKGQSELDARSTLTVIAGKAVEDGGASGRIGQFRKAVLGPGEEMLTGETRKALLRNDIATECIYVCAQHGGRTRLRAPRSASA